MEKLVFKHFTEVEAHQLGEAMYAEGMRRMLPIVIDIRRGDSPLYAVSLPGASAVNFDWARRKRNLVMLTEKSSWSHSLDLANGKDIIAEMSLDSRDYTAHGGCVPIFVEGAGLVATVTISGLPQKEDHDFAVLHLEKLLATQQ